MMDLLLYRMQCRLVAFWQANPAKMAIFMALFVWMCMATGFLGAIRLSHLVSDGIWGQMAVIGPTIALGAYVFFQVSERWLQMISRDCQAALIARLPPGTVPVRRLCKLEASLIQTTQDPAHRARVMGRALHASTARARGQQAPRRL